MRLVQSKRIGLLALATLMTLSSQEAKPARAAAPLTAPQVTETCLVDPSPESCCDPAQLLTEGDDETDRFPFPAKDPARCVFSSGGDDRVFTGNSGDVIVLGEGEDFVLGRDGDDIVLGGRGNDWILGHKGDDSLYGGLEDDEIHGGQGADFIVAGAGADRVMAGAGEDTVRVYDICELEPGESLDGGPGNDVLILPVSLAEYEALGATVRSFETILVDAEASRFSECSLCSCRSAGGAIVCCNDRGSCRGEDSPGKLACECDPGFIGSDCSAASQHAFSREVPDNCEPDDPGCQLQFTNGFAFAEEFDPNAVCPDLGPWDEEEMLLAEIYHPSDENDDWLEGEFPLAVFIHGNGQQYQKYDELMEHFALNGLVAASIHAPTNSSENDRAQLLVCATRFLRSTWSEAQRLAPALALLGHSRGGEGAAIAAFGLQSTGNALDQEASEDLQAVLSLAPGALTGFELASEHTPAFLVLQGSFDDDTTARGITLFDDAGEDETSLGEEKMLRSFVWPYSVRHNEYGGHDSCVDPPPCLGDEDCPIGSLCGGDMKCINPTCRTTEKGVALGRAYLGGFLLWHLSGQNVFRPGFTGTALPDSVSDPALWAKFGGEPRLYTQYREGTLFGGNRLIIDGFEDGELETSALGGLVTPSGGLDVEVGEAGALNSPYSQKSRTFAARVAWSGTAETLVFEIPAQAGLGSYSHLSFRLAHAFDRQGVEGCETADDPALAFTVALGDGNDVFTVSTDSYGGLPIQDHGPPLTGSGANPAAPWHDADCHAADFMRTLRIPLNDFCDAGLSISDLETLEFRFDQTTAGEILLDSIELSRSDLDPGSYFCEEQGGGGGGGGGGDPCDVEGPGCPGFECLDIPVNEGHAAHDRLRFCQKESFICRPDENSPNGWGCRDCNPLADFPAGFGGEGCPCHPDLGPECGPLPANDLECFGYGDPFLSQNPLGACWSTNDGTPAGFCLENCGECRDQVCSSVEDVAEMTICVTPEVICGFPLCELDGLVCNQETGECQEECIEDCDCPAGLTCVDGSCL